MVLKVLTVYPKRITKKKKKYAVIIIRIPMWSKEKMTLKTKYENETKFVPFLSKSLKERKYWIIK